MGDIAQKQLDKYLTSPGQQGLMDALTRKLRFGESTTAGYWNWDREAAYEDERGVWMTPGTWVGERDELSWLETDPSQIVSRWQATIANPMMKAWERTAGPMSKRKYNLPGSFYSADASRGMMGDAEAFLSTNLMPSLYSSIENMYSRLSNLLASSTTAKTQDTDVVEKKYWTGEIGGGLAAIFGGL